MKSRNKSIGRSTTLGSACGLVILLVYLLSILANAQTEPGRISHTSGPITKVPTSATAISPFDTETGQISLSIDGLGTLNSTGTIRVEKPSGATVRKAFLGSATTPFASPLLNGEVSLNGTGVNWNSITTGSFSTSNAFADVTSIVKPVVDAAPPGIVNFTVMESRSNSIDGEVLAVIFDDPNQTTSNTIIILFGAQNTTGDTFNVLLADPITDTTLPIDMSLGISFGFQPSTQFSRVDVNGMRLTSSAGGQDDGMPSNGALLTAGGIGDSNANPPDPLAPATDPRSDDELYDLRPFVQVGDTTITVATQNPSNDDNIFFAAFFFKGATAVVGEGIVLGPASATNPTGSSHTVTASLQNSQGQPIAGRMVSFEIIAGPNLGLTGSGVTNANGQAQFTYSSALPGTDQIVARFTNNQNQLVTSNTVTKTWMLSCMLNCPGNIIRSNDPNQCGAIVSYALPTASGCSMVACTPPPGSFFPVGTTSVTCTAIDAAGNPSSCSFTVTVNDNQAPAVSCSIASSVLWPPNHNLINVGLTGSATDNCSGALSIQVTVFGDEDDEEATGDGTHSPDAKNIALNTLRLRSERKGDADGRVYLIVVKATDAAGNVGTCCRTVVVAHDQSPRSLAEVQAQAQSAQAFCQANGGAPPPGYFIIGDGPVVGPKQ